MHMEIKMPTLENMCFSCFGTGKVRAMQLAMTYDAGAIRDKDTKVKCNICNGTGYERK